MSKSEKKPIDLPRALVELFVDRKEAEVEIARAALVDLVRRGKISPHQGAEILRMRDEDFAVLIRDEEIPTIDYRQHTIP
jgi:predicted HTH domain antitoxin